MRTMKNSRSNFKWNTDITFKFQCNQATRKKKKKKKMKKEKKKKENKKRKKKKISNNKNKKRMKNQSWCKVKG